MPLCTDEVEVGGESRAFEELLRRATGAGAELYVACAGVRDLSRIRVRLGRDAADVCLRTVIGRLRTLLSFESAVMGSDGDRLLFACHDVTEDRFLELLEAFRGVLDQPFQLDQSELFTVGVAIGWAGVPKHAADLSAGIDSAMLACELAADTGRECVEFRDDSVGSSLMPLRVATDLRAALAHEASGLFLRYQPKIDAVEHRLHGVEALLRWDHPVHGPVPPPLTIQAAQSAGVMGELTKWIIRTAIRATARFSEFDLDVPISINLTASDLQNEAIVCVIDDALREYGGRAEQLTFEITETDLIEDIGRASKTVEAIRSLGSAASLDDFGTGYSSLAQLRELPVDELKIDKTFVDDLLQESRADEIIGSLIALAHSLDLRVVAEGVETPHVWAWLRERGCDIGQGFLFAPPLKFDETLHWIQARCRPTAEQNARPGAMELTPIVIGDELNIDRPADEEGEIVVGNDEYHEAARHTTGFAVEDD